MSRAGLETIGKIDVSMLAALRLVLAERSVGKAAIDIGLSQPAMSNALSRMRTAFDDPLLVRVHGKMELTARGEQLLGQLNSILPQLEELAHPLVFTPERADTNFRIAATDHAVQVLGPLIIAEFTKRAPNARLHLSTVQSKELDSDDVDAFDLRLGWFVSPPPSWMIRSLLVDAMVIAVGEANPLVGDAIDEEQFAQLQHVGILTRAHPTGMDRVLTERGLARNVTVWLSNFSAIPYILQRSNLIALVPGALANRYKAVGGIRILPPPRPLREFGVSMAWSPTVHHDPANRWLRSLVLDCVRELPEGALNRASLSADSAMMDAP